MPHFVFDTTAGQSIRIVVAIWLTTVSLQNICLSVASADSPMPIDWARQLGGTDADFGRSLAVDALGNVFVTGSTIVRSEPVSLPTDFDFFLAKYDRLGTLLWDKKIRSDQSESSNSVGLDGAGNAYITGWVTASSLTGDNRDVFVTKYDTNGNELWSRAFGTTSDEIGLDISVDAVGNAIIGGFTTGNFGSVNSGSLDAYIAKVDNDGNLLWSKQFGSAGHDAVRSLTVDGLGNIYVSGEAAGKLGATHFGIFDAYVAKIDADSVPVWVRQLGTTSYDRANAIAVDGKDNILVGGFAFAGDTKAALAKFNSDGILVWTQQFGARHNGDIEGIAIDSSGIPYLIGQTSESDWAPNAGLQDAFVIKLRIPEPATALLLMIGWCGIAVRSRCLGAKRSAAWRA